jgi:formylglycine-generating enzyme required for sulfatase activity
LAAVPAPETAPAVPIPAVAAPEPIVVAASEPDAAPAAPASGPEQPSDAPAPDAPSDEPIASTRVALASGTDDIGRWADLRVLGITQRFRWCPPGTFLMGSPDGEHRRGRDEDIHQVTLTKGFWIADTECSQALWITVMGSSPSAVQDLSHPVERVAWDQCHVFLARLDRLCPGIAARLPSESEWEYACRAGGADSTPIESSAWFSRTSGGQTHPIAQLQPNTWGLFDMRGNVAEWCEDGYAPYPKPVVVDPAPQPGNARAVRGGSCRDDATACRPAHRGHQRQQAVSDQVGLRLALGCGDRLPTLGARPATAP